VATEVTTTIKGDGAAPWIVVHTDTPQENEKMLTEVLEGLLQTAAESNALFTGAVTVARGTGPSQPAQQDRPQQDRQQVQQNQGGWNGGGQQQQSAFNGTPHPEGKTCGQCGAGLIGKQPKVKKMWTCPNQRTQGDGHTVEWINS
jgi:hypothetical protein